MKDRTTLIDGDRIRDRLVNLVRIPSITGDEEQAIRHIADWLSDGGAEVDYWYDGIGRLLMDPAYPGHEVERAWVPVVAGMIRGARPGPTVLLTGHVDVVPPGDYEQWSRDPYSGFVDGDRVYGRGASDMKSGIAAALEAFETFARGPRDFPGRVVLIAVPAEEDSGLGTLAAIRRGWTADAAIVTEPTCRDGYPEIIVAHAGAMSCLLEIPGAAAHASKRLKGESALEHYLAVHEVLRNAEAAVNANETHPLMQELQLPYATNVGLIRGGSWSSTVMDSLQVELRIGVTLNETTAEAKERFERALTEGLSHDRWLTEHPPRLHWRAAGFGSAETPSDHPLVDYLGDAGQVAFGERPHIAGAPYGCDMSAWVRIANTPTVLYGPGDIVQAHAADEWVSLTTTLKVTQALVRTTASLLELDPSALQLSGTRKASV
ncbi:M20 family metallopeptidase [Arhodomonas sp. AD133]|uniref:M20 family metallopeptidase n=1 Tax=Arhodomonas sp. AD133 TaxID=3415009 RepID=UPI003EB6E7B8